MPASILEIAPSRPSRVAPRRVLVVDDSLEVAESLTRLLECAGHVTAFVINPLDALDAAEGFYPEVIFIDIAMPQMDGWELARMFRGRFGYDAIRLVALTALGGASDHVRSRKAGFDAHLTKPFNLEVIQSAIETVFDSPNYNRAAPNTIGMSLRRQGRVPTRSR
jgi:two-component system OmpR family response regulator